MAMRDSLVGKRFGRLTVVGEMPKRHDKRYWRCLCDCGREAFTSTVSLNKGNTKSCGCLQRDMTSAAAMRHGQKANNKQSAEYTAWLNMISRCENARNQAYIYYGGRGIRVCDRWKCFDLFFADMGKKPSNKHSLDRLNVNGDYELSNCRWATPLIQCHNKRAHKNNKSGHPGVDFRKGKNVWRARISVSGKPKHIGYFNSFEAAVSAYKAEKEAILNSDLGESCYAYNNL